MIDVKREAIQQQAFEAWVKADRKGICQMATGTGKTMVAIKAILSMPKGSSVLWLAETNQRWLDVGRDIIKFKQFYGIDLLEHIGSFEKVCYQTAYKWRNKNHTIVVMD